MAVRLRSTPNFSSSRLVFESESPDKWRRIPTSIAGRGVRSRSTNSKSIHGLDRLRRSNLVIGNRNTTASSLTEHDCDDRTNIFTTPRQESGRLTLLSATQGYTMSVGRITFLTVFTLIYNKIIKKKIHPTVVDDCLQYRIRRIFGFVLSRLNPERDQLTGRHGISLLPR